MTPLLHHKVRLGALQQVHELIREHSFSETTYHAVVTGLVSSLEVYENQEEQFNDLAIDVLALLGQTGTTAIPVLMKMLRDMRHQYLHEKIVKALFLIGELGIQALVEAASEAYTHWDSFILLRRDFSLFFWFLVLRVFSHFDALQNASCQSPARARSRCFASTRS